METKMQEDGSRKWACNAYQFWNIIHLSFHFQAHDLKFDLAFLICWSLIVLRGLHKLEYCQSNNQWLNNYPMQNNKQNP